MKTNYQLKALLICVNVQMFLLFEVLELGMICKSFVESLELTLRVYLLWYANTNVSNETKSKKRKKNTVN